MAGLEEEDLLEVVPERGKQWLLPGEWACLDSMQEEQRLSVWNILSSVSI